MINHHGGTPFTCDDCGKAFTNSANYKQHMDRHVMDGLSDQGSLKTNIKPVCVKITKLKPNMILLLANQLTDLENNETKKDLTNLNSRIKPVYVKMKYLSADSIQLLSGQRENMADSIVDDVDKQFLIENDNLKDVPDDSDMISNEYAEILNYAVKVKAQNKTLKTIFENDDKDSSIL